MPNQAKILSLVNFLNTYGYVHDYNENYGFRKQFLKINSLDVMFAF